MSLYYATKKVVSIFKGTTPVVEAYSGTDIVYKKKSAQSGLKITLTDGTVHYFSPEQTNGQLKIYDYNSSTEVLTFAAPYNEVIDDPHTIKEIEDVDGTILTVTNHGCFGLTCLTDVSLKAAVTFERDAIANSNQSLTALHIPKLKYMGTYGSGGVGGTLSQIAVADLDAPELLVMGNNNFHTAKGLKVIHLPKLQQIEQAAFCYCTSLASVDFSGHDDTIPQINSTYMFTGANSGYRIVVPWRKLDAWKNASGWKNFASHIYPGGEVSYDLADGSADDIGNIVYTGSEQTPVVNVYNNLKTKLTKNVDYTLSYLNNVEVGTATAVMTGIGSYSGTLNKNFTIISNSLQSIIVGPPRFCQNQSGSPVTLASDQLVVKNAAGQTLTAGIHYVVSYQNNDTEGIATVTVTGKSPYVGTLTADFEIYSYENGKTVTYLTDGSTNTYVISGQLTYRNNGRNNYWSQNTTYQKVSVGPAVDGISTYCYYNCAALEELDMTRFTDASKLPVLLGTNAFSYVSSNFKITVADETIKTALASMTNWSAYASKIEVATQE